MAVPIVPKRTGEVEVEVASVFQGEWQNIADSVRRTLFVVVSKIVGDTQKCLHLESLVFLLVLLIHASLGHNNGIKHDSTSCDTGFVRSELYGG